jgi:hypothetical protein
MTIRVRAVPVEITAITQPSKAPESAIFVGPSFWDGNFHRIIETVGRGGAGTFGLAGEITQFNVVELRRRVVRHDDTDVFGKNASNDNGQVS